jgi:hypothetical protein
LIGFLSIFTAKYKDHDQDEEEIPNFCIVDAPDIPLSFLSFNHNEKLFG